MNKLILGVVPVCVTFGPIFMVITSGSFPQGHPIFFHAIMDCGAVMLGLGLAAMFKLITKQQNLIEKLQADARPAA